MQETRKYTVVDLFAGVGGLSYGFSRNDHFEIILANEMQKDIRILRKHIPSTILRSICCKETSKICPKMSSVKR